MVGAVRLHPHRPSSSSVASLCRAAPLGPQRVCRGGKRLEGARGGSRERAHATPHGLWRPRGEAINVTALVSVYAGQMNKCVAEGR